MKLDVLKWEFTQVNKKYKVERYFGAYNALVGELAKIAT